MLTDKTIFEIKDKIQQILDREHKELEKRKIDETHNCLRFACPKCGDSHSNPRKKRGQAFYNSGYYHCYNCNWHTSLIKFFENFGFELDDVNARINIRKSVQSYIDSGITKNVDEISQEKIDQLNEYALDKNEIMEKMGLLPLFPSHEYVQKKKLHHKINHMAFKRGNIVFFNMIDETKVLGFQIRTFNPKYITQMKYIKYPIVKIYDQFFPDRKPNTPNFDSLNKISLLYNLLNVDFNKPVTVFEGPSDSWLYPNSIGKSSVGLADEFLDEVHSIRYFFDNDSAGYKKMKQKIEKGKKVFLWKKFLDDHELWDYEIKDWADIIQVSVKLNKPLYRDAENYFSNETLDLIYV